MERFLDGMVPSEADALVAEGGEADLRRALELEPGRADAAVPLARLLADAGDREGALAVLDERRRIVRRRRPRRAAAAVGRPGAGRPRSTRWTPATPRRALDALIEAIAAATAIARTSCGAWSSACWTSSVSSTRSRASRGASSLPPLY